MLNIRTNFLAAFAKPLLPAGRFISRNLNKNKMKAIGLKLICERADGEITTWHDVFETTVEDVIRKVRHQKRWMGGKFLEAYWSLTMMVNTIRFI